MLICKFQAPILYNKVFYILDREYCNGGRFVYNVSFADCDRTNLEKMTQKKEPMEGEDDVECTVSKACFLEEFKEVHEMRELIDSLPNICGDMTAVETAYERFLCKLRGFTKYLQIAYDSLTNSWISVH